MGFFDKWFGTHSEREVKRINGTLTQILALEKEYAAMEESELKAQTEYLRGRLADGASLDDILPRAFATVREAAYRVLGMKHYPVQLIGGVVLHQGRIAEMKTGEGKTLVATLPAYLNALSGKGVHIVTVNDYLARRDSEWMGKVYRYLGLKVGLVVHGMTAAEKRESYAADITYGTNNEFGFDYLRDNMALYKEDMVQRGHNFAIVDEVDSILIDEARTPLIISGVGAKSTELYGIADAFVRTLSGFKMVRTDDKVDYDKFATMEYDEILMGQALTAEQHKKLTNADFIVDEKSKNVTLTAQGVQKAEASFHVENLASMENMELSHHINQALRAHNIMHRDTDYVVKDGQVIIVDEFTGRLMYGRRYNQGLHQAIEAKERVTVEKESKTLASITLQNYFRMYNKLSGMTGTALTEEEEFRHIYSLDVVEIPTNRPAIRDDKEDLIFKTEMGKFTAVIEQIRQCHEKGQPVLVGTVTIEKSELLSKLLKKAGIKHNVLNAKHHEKEAGIIAQAGHFGAVTIATNMAGRGTDIMLGGNAEYMAKEEMRRKGFEEEMISEATGFAETDDADILAARETYQKLYNSYRENIAEEADKVRAAGGLFILGTERHESRRIDNQLRGRAGRQGDPGMTQFYLSAEDDLMRLFGGERLSAMMNTLRLPEDMPIENKMLTGIIERAQEKVEGINFGRRKSVLEYDDVMNIQREIIYDQRASVLNGDNLQPSIQKMIDDIIDQSVAQFIAGENPDEWNIKGLQEQVAFLLGETVLPTEVRTIENMQAADFAEIISESAAALYAAKEEELGADTMREAERVMLLRSVDSRWMNHIDDLEELKRGIGLVAYGQRSPIVEFRLQSADMFDEMVENIKYDTLRTLLSLRLRKEEEIERTQVAKEVSAGGSGEANSRKPVTVSGKVGRNDPCPCGSGKKYKKCCGAE